MVLTFAAFAKSVTAFTESLDELSARLVREQTARVVNETRAASTNAPAYRITIGGKASRVLDGPLPDVQIQPGNVVQLYFDHRRDIAVETLRVLLKNSPEISGDYKNAYTFYVNETEMFSTAEALQRIVPDAKVEIINKAPYARKLEVGKSIDGSAFVVQVPKGIVERSAAAVSRSRFGRLADVYFTFRDTSDAYILKGREVGTLYTDNLGRLVRRQPKADRVRGQAVSYPAVIIAERAYRVRNG